VASQSLILELVQTAAAPVHHSRVDSYPSMKTRLIVPVGGYHQYVMTVFNVPQDIFPIFFLAGI